MERKSCFKENKSHIIKFNYLLKAVLSVKEFIDKGIFPTGNLITQQRLFAVCCNTEKRVDIIGCCHQTVPRAAYV